MEPLRQWFEIILPQQIRERQSETRSAKHAADTAQRAIEDAKIQVEDVAEALVEASLLPMPAVTRAQNTIIVPPTVHDLPHSYNRQSDMEPSTVSSEVIEVVTDRVEASEDRVRKTLGKV